MGEALKRQNQNTYKQFLAIPKDVEGTKYMDSEIILQAMTNLNNQSIVLNIVREFTDYFKCKKCNPFIAPFDIVLGKEKEEIKGIQPDIFIVCGEKPSNQNEFMGIPTLIIEVTSPSNPRNDIVTKLKLYKMFGVNEYWRVSPKNKSAEVFEFDELTRKYKEPILYLRNDIVNSNAFNDLSIELKKIFK